MWLLKITLWAKQGWAGSHNIAVSRGQGSESDNSGYNIRYILSRENIGGREKEVWKFMPP